MCWSRGLENDQGRGKHAGAQHKEGVDKCEGITEGELTGLDDRFDRGSEGERRVRATLKFPDWGLDVC